MSTEKPTSPPEPVVANIYLPASFEGDHGNDPDRVGWRVDLGQIESAEITAERAMREAELATDLDMHDGVIRVRAVRYDGVFDGRTGRYISIKSKTRATDAEDVKDEASEARPQKPANAFLPLTTTEQVERRDAIKLKLEKKRRALTERSA